MKKQCLVLDIRVYPPGKRRNTGSAPIAQGQVSIRRKRNGKYAIEGELTLGPEHEEIPVWRLEWGDWPL